MEVVTVNTLNNKEIMAQNIERLMNKKGIDRKMLSAGLGISYTTISDWLTAKTYPRIDKIEMMADYFGVSKSELVEEDAYPQFDSSSFQMIYDSSEEEKEILEAYLSLPKEGKDRAARFLFDLQTEYHRKAHGNISQSTLDLIETLLTANDIAVQGLAQNSQWRYQQVNKLNAEFTGFLKDALLLINSGRENTTEFINLKRKIYEAVFPLNYIIIADEKGVNTVEGLADRYHVSQEFIVAAIGYYVISKGIVTEYDGYLIDFSEIPSNYDDPIIAANAEVIVTDTNESRIAEKNAKKKKGFFRR